MLGKPEKHKHPWIFFEGLQDERASWFFVVIFFLIGLVWLVLMTLSVFPACLLATVRNNYFPTSTGGKGADTSILSAWMEHAMDNMALRLI